MLQYIDETIEYYLPPVNHEPTCNKTYLFHNAGEIYDLTKREDIDRLNRSGADQKIKKSNNSMG